ncbi:MAG: cytochrome c biogenesis protein ResB, partial [Deltaproteobacteria bacterium]|nr:cytochrome c biogenesis protein ResB [Deltaproteobacteria bacterium]
LLFVNIVLGGMVRIRKGWSMAGILITHVGIAMLLVSGFVKLYYSQDGHVTLYEGERTDVYQSYYDWEVAITEELPDGSAREHVVPQEDFLHTQGGGAVTLRSEALPFALELAHFMPNASPLPKGPMFEVDVPVVDGFFLRDRPKEVEAERNVAGLYAAAVTPDGQRQEGILFGLTSAPWTVQTAEGRYAVELRKQRYPMPFTVVLDDFTKEDHPGVNMPKAFMSDVTVIEDGSIRPVRIEMNQPLRDGGLVLYQAYWGPSNAAPGTPLFSTLSVVQNPADQWPLYSCIVIALGLVLHFSRKLGRYVRVEARKA